MKNDGFEPISHDSSMLILGIADEDEDLATIWEFGTQTNAFIIGKVSASEIEFCLEFSQKGFTQHFAWLVLRGIH